MSGSAKRPVLIWISLVIMAFSGVMGIDRVPNGRNNPAGFLKTSSDPIYASSAISITPYPTWAGVPTIVAVDLQNPTNNEIAISLAFSYAEFGIGLPFYPIDGVINLVIPPHGIAQPAVVWIPPHGGLWCLQVVVAMPDQQEIIAQRNIDVIEPLLPGVMHELAFPVGNPLDHTVDITMGSVAHVSGWGIGLNPDLLPNMQAGEVREVTLSVTPPQGTPLPPDGTIIVDVEAYAGQQLIGGFRKIFRPPVALHVFPDPAYAEREISISPYPVRLGEPTQVCVELRNPTSTARDVVVNFAWANFGIGLPFTPIDGPQLVHLPPYSIVKTCIFWVPPVSGHFCLQVRLDMDGYLPQVSQRNLDVNEPLLPGVTHELTFPVGNPLDHAVDITMASVAHVSGWGIGLNPAVLLNMQAGEVRLVTLSVTPPQGTPLPPDGTIIVDVEAYAGHKLIGGFRKIFFSAKVMLYLPIIARPD